MSKDMDVSEHACALCRKEFRYDLLHMTEHGEAYVRALSSSLLHDKKEEPELKDYRMLRENKLEITNLFCAECCERVELALTVEDITE